MEQKVKKNMIFLGTEVDKLTEWKLNLKFDSREVDVNEEKFNERTRVYLYMIAEITETGEIKYRDDFQESRIDFSKLNFPVDISEIRRNV